MENQKKEWKKIELKKIDINLDTESSGTGTGSDYGMYS